MRDSELQESTARTVETEHYQVETCVAYNYAEGYGEYQVRLSPDAQALPAPCRPYLKARQARQLARDLIAQADAADARNGIGPCYSVAAGEAFLAEQLDRDDMTLAEIVAGLIEVVTGDTFEPAGDEPDGYEPARLQAEPRPATS